MKGLVTKPAEGLRRDGASGLAIGTVQGIAGLVVKPVTGAIDLVSKTSQGIEAASTKDNQDGSDTRIRPPRVFYGKEKVIRNYSIIHAKLHLLIPRL